MRRIFGIVMATHRRFGADSGGFNGAALTYHAFLSVFPLLLLGASVLGFMLANDPFLRARVTDGLSTVLPGLGSAIADNIEAVVRTRSATGIIGLAGLLWTGTGVADAASLALAHVDRMNAPASTVRKKLRSIVSLFTLGIIGIAGLATSVVTTMIDIAGPAAVAVRAGGLVVSLGIDAVFFLVAYRLLGPKGRPIGDLVPGAILSAVAWTVIKFVGGAYAAKTVADSTAIYGTFASTIGVFVVLALAARVFLYGAELNAVLAERKESEGTMDERQRLRSADGSASTPQLVRSIATDTATLVRKEVELARQEIVEALVAKIAAAGAMVGAAVMALLALAFLGAAAASGLERVMEPWAARLVVAGGFTLLAVAAAAIGAMRARAKKMKPEMTVETVKEDIEWAKAQLKR